jgi:hypothetical protein
MRPAPGATICCGSCEAISDTASQRPQKKYRIKLVERDFFYLSFLLAPSSAPSFSPAMDVIIFWGLIHLGADQSTSLETFKKATRAAARLQRE